jgi:hypothetical protein
MIAASEAVSICRKIHRTHHHFVIATRACSTTRGIEVDTFGTSSGKLTGLETIN